MPVKEFSSGTVNQDWGLKFTHQTSKARFRWSFMLNLSTHIWVAVHRAFHEGKWGNMSGCFAVHGQPFLPHGFSQMQHGQKLQRILKDKKKRVYQVAHIFSCSCDAKGQQIFASPIAPPLATFPRVARAHWCVSDTGRIAVTRSTNTSLLNQEQKSRNKTTSPHCWRKQNKNNSCVWWWIRLTSLLPPLRFSARQSF